MAWGSHRLQPRLDLYGRWKTFNQDKDWGHGGDGKIIINGEYFKLVCHKGLYFNFLHLVYY